MGVTNFANPPNKKETFRLKSAELGASTRQPKVELAACLDRKCGAERRQWPGKSPKAKLELVLGSLLTWFCYNLSYPKLRKEQKLGK